MTKRTVALIIAGVWLVLIIVSLASESWAQISYPPGRWPAADPYGHVYPEQCKKDLSFLIRTTNIVNDRRVEDMFPSYNGRNMGYFVELPNPTIYIDRSVKNDATYRIMLHHELCHALMYRLTGDALWHPRRRAWQSRKRSRRRSSPFARLSSQ